LFKGIRHEVGLPPIIPLGEDEQMKKISSVIESVLHWASQRGEKLLDNGVRLVEPAPDIAPKAWRHIVYPPITENEILGIETTLRQRLPQDLREFYKNYNGISLFGGGVTIWGKRQDYVREGDGMWQPFDLVQHNAAGNRPSGSPYQLIYFGSSERGSNRLFFEPDSGEIGKTSAYSFTEIVRWPNFKAFILSEIAKQA
jgi:hypothetical protein